MRKREKIERQTKTDSAARKQKQNDKEEHNSRDHNPDLGKIKREIGEKGKKVINRDKVWRGDEKITL